ncbi:MAG: hypothetical protein ACREK2_07805 [Gemmatimonadota bacterium]
MTKSRSVHRMAIPLLAALAVACTNWVPRPASVEDVVRSREIPRVRIQARGETVVLQFPRILGDSLVGSTTTPKGMRILDERVTYSLDEVVVIEVEVFDWERTTLAIGALLGAWFCLILLAAGSTT